MSNLESSVLGLELDPGDHRALGQRLGLFHFQDAAPGMVFWHPRGFAMVRALEEAVRRQLALHQYREVRTPQVLRRPVWEASGHWEHFSDGMMRIADPGGVEAALKPVSCPGHAQIVGRRAPSWRELPIRLAEFGVVHRDEPSGTLHGLLRLRQFTQDDGHLFCADEHVVPEIERFARSVAPFYRALGFPDVRVVLSTRPKIRAGDDASWDRAEAWLARAAAVAELQVALAPGGGAFYGPKLEFVLRDRLGRDWQCGTLQVDLVMPARFDLRYAARSGERPHVVMLHRALLGSVERFLGVVLEQHGAELPAWLAPDQVAVLPVEPAQREEALALAAALRSAGLRVVVDDDDENLGPRIARSRVRADPFAVIVGARDLAAGVVTVRSRSDEGPVPRDQVVDRLARACTPPV
ncbi:MAG: threonine--tRNA ligase [Myxococcota bacterium]